MSTWWEARRTVRLAGLAYGLEFFGAEPVEDPGVGELSRVAGDLAGEYRASDLGPAVHRAGDFLDLAAGALHAADGLRGTLLPVVNHHLRHAASALDDARACLLGQASPATSPPGHSAPPWDASASTH
ncbi:hypothetical protein ACFRAR_14520 [Kitasatospora sp. NPDC056651]|uniref:hypothetical protein n=1 Tax=Kitasatospora sp. NPDC056651 TaxID=3345892 RepID=UPI0036ACD020